MACSCVLEIQQNDPCLFNGEFSTFITIVMTDTSSYFVCVIYPAYATLLGFLFSCFL